MKAERMAIYGWSFPKRFEGAREAVRRTRDKLGGLPQSYFPRAAKEGEHIIEVGVDPNGTPYERGDILLDLSITSKDIPDLCGDWEIVQTRPRWTRKHSGEITGWFRYLLIRPAKASEAAKAREIQQAHHRRIAAQTMDS